MPAFAPGDIIRCISYIFKDKKLEMKSTHLRMNPRNCSASFKEIHLFLQSLVEGYFFILIIFHSKFNLINMSGFCGSVGLSGCCDE